MNKKIIRTISWVLLFLFINQSCDIKAAHSYTIDSSWVTIDTTTVSNSGKTLNEFINDLIISQPPGNKNFYIKDGTYILNDSIKIEVPGVIIYGQSKTNTKLIQTNPGAKSIAVTQNNIHVSNLYIDGSVGQQVFHAQNGLNVHDVSLEDCIIYGSNIHSAISFYGQDGANKSFNNRILRNEIHSPTGVDLGSTMDGAVVFYWQKDAFVNDNIIIGSRLWLNECENLEISTNTIKDSIVEGGIRVNLLGENIKIINNTIKNTAASAIAVVDESSNSNRYSGIEIKNNNITISKYFGIEVRNLENAIISDNKISEIDFMGIFLLFSDYVTVEKNIISNCGLSQDPTSSWKDLKAGILMDTDVKNSKIQNNTISNISNCLFAIKVKDYSTSNNTYNEIKDNLITGNFNEGISADDENNFITIETFKVQDLKAKITEISKTKANITLTWTGILGITDYQVMVDENATDVREVINKTTYVLPDNVLIDSNSSYRVRMKYGNWSEEIKVKAIHSPLPSPNNIKALSAQNSITVTWDNVEGAKGYQIKVDGSVVDVGTSSIYTHTVYDNLYHTYLLKSKDEIWNDGQWSSEILANTITTPPSVVNITTPAAVNMSSSKKHKHRDSNNYILEIAFGNRKSLNYKEQFNQDSDEDKLRRMILYTFAEQYYLKVSSLENNKIALNYQLAISLIPGKLFTDSEIKNISIDENDDIDTVLVQDMGTDHNNIDKLEEAGLAEYSIDNGFIFSIGNLGMQLKRNESYSEDIQ